MKVQDLGDFRGSKKTREFVFLRSKKKQQKEAVAPRWYRGMGKEQCRERMQKHENDAKKSTKRNLNPPACSGVDEKSMAEQARRKEAKRCEKEAVDPSWYQGI